MGAAGRGRAGRGARAPAARPPALRLKWPNDVLLDGRKLAGILLDSAVRAGRRLDWLVIGCGVNLARAPPCRAAGRRARGCRHRRDAGSRRGRGCSSGCAIGSASGWWRASPLCAAPGSRGRSRSARRCTVRFAGQVLSGHVRRARRGRRPAAAPAGGCARLPPATILTRGEATRCCWSSMPATPTWSSPCMTARHGAASGASPPSRSARRTNTRVWLLTLLDHAGLKRDRHRRRGDRHRGAGRAVSSAPAVPGLVRGRAADRARQARLGVRDQGGQAGRGRRRPAAERAGGAPASIAAR